MQSVSVCAFPFAIHNTKTFAVIPLHSLNSDKDEGKYKFGDLTRNFIRKVSTKNLKKNELGDAMRSIDKTDKQYVAKASGKEEYQFGDLSKYLITQSKTRRTLSLGTKNM